MELMKEEKNFPTKFVCIEQIKNEVYIEWGIYVLMDNTLIRYRTIGRAQVLGNASFWYMEAKYKTLGYDIGIPTMKLKFTSR
jgi:hypothetical protein